MDEVLRSAADRLSTKDVVLWCRANRFTPQKTDADGYIEEESSATGFGYCKFCGSYRDRHGNDDSHCPHKPSEWNPRKRALHAVSSVDTLLDQLPAGWDTISEGGKSFISIFVALVHYSF